MTCFSVYAIAKKQNYSGKIILLLFFEHNAARFFAVEVCFTPFHIYMSKKQVILQKIAKKNTEKDVFLCIQQKICVLFVQINEHFALFSKALHQKMEPKSKIRNHQQTKLRPFRVLPLRKECIQSHLLLFFSV